MSGQKPIPYALLIKLIKALDVDAEMAASLKASHTELIDDNSVPKKGVTESLTALESWDLAGKTDFNILRQWFYLPILDMTTLTNFDGRIESIAERLGISLPAAQVAVRELLAKDLLTEKDGRIMKSTRRIRWAAGQPISDIRNFHDQMLAKAQNELRNATTPEEFQRRLIMGITVTTTNAKIEAAKKKLAECLHDIANDLMQEQGEEVFHLSGQFFPLTKKKY